MHAVIQDGLEEYLGGHTRRDFQAHLDECAECRTEVLEFRELSGLFREMREAEPIAVDPGFYFRLSENLEARKRPSFWNLFSLDGVFGRRVAFASLMALTVMGGVLISQETGDIGIAAAPAAPAIMASHDFSAPHEAGADRDRMMVTLASYEH
jgi:predicted anti-sigma-YlaC factor YlaD